LFANPVVDFSGRIFPISQYWFENHARKHAQSMLAHTLKDGGLLNWCHRLAIKQTPANRGEKMSTITTTTSRNSNMNTIVTLALMLIVIVTIAVARPLVAQKAAVVPVTGSQDALVEYLRGEKVIYTNPFELSNVLTAYHLGEKATYANAADLSSALMAYHLAWREVCCP
jgi:hypothetical protein